MEILRGQGVSGGVARGPLWFYGHSRERAQARRGCDPARERERLEKARRQAALALEELARRARERAGEEGGALFETHALLLEDEDFIGAMDRLAGEGYSAEYAAEQAGEELAALLEAMEDPYMRERCADVRDVAGRLRDLLAGAGEEALPEGPVVLCAQDLAPSQTLRLDRDKILAIATRGGSGSSHTAILARAMGIPAVCGLGEGLCQTLQGREAWVLGEEGQVILDAAGEQLERLKARLEEQTRRRELLRELAGREDVTLDGRRLSICCNIGAPEEVEAVLSSGGGGIGLFRSEFLYLASRDWPTEEEQYEAYRKVARAMGGRRVVVRTLDIGADKGVDYFPLAREENPALGLRGVRVSLSRPEVFRTQLRALYRASAWGKIAIMFPMIASLWEVEECRRLCGQVMDQLEEEGVPFNRETEVGIMVETPAAVLMAPELAQKADFFSVGTNDLTQYTLACDRQNSGLGRFFDPRHPAVLRSVELAARAAHEAGIWIGICGELGADPELLPAFLDMGIHEVSVSPPAVLPLRAALRKIGADGRAQEG